MWATATLRIYQNWFSFWKLLTKKKSQTQKNVHIIIKQQFFETVANMKKTYIENGYYYCSKSIEINDWSRCQFRKKNSLWEKVSLWKQNKRSKAFFIDSTDVKKTKLFNLRLLIDNKLSRNVNKKFQRKRIIAELHARARRAWAESRC